jgi:cell division protein FtsQ
MALKINIRKILSVTVWCFVGAGVVVLLVAAIRYRNNNTCKGYRIVISAPAGVFIDKKQIAALLTPGGAGVGAGAGAIQDKPIQSFDLRRMESALEKNIWIRKARLFFDNNGLLQVEVFERTPATRIFTTAGASFYLDSEGVKLPLIAQLPARLPVFTGFPPTSSASAGSPASQKADSALTAGIRQISRFIRNDSFWMAQIAQVNITPDRTFELEPEIGNHRIIFGDASDIEAKFHRLFVFYKEVLSKTGFDKYERIDISYDDQIVATKKGSTRSRYDSLQGMNNIRQLIRSAQSLQPDTLRQQAVRPLEHNTMTEQNLANYDLLPGSGDSSAGKPTGTAAKPAGQITAARQAGQTPKGKKPKP